MFLTPQNDVDHRFTWYCADMPKRNLTLQLDDDVIRRAKVIAAERDTSVSRLVADQLDELVTRDASYDAAHRRVLRQLDQVRGRNGERRWSRSDLHERATPDVR